MGQFTVLTIFVYVYVFVDVGVKNERCESLVTTETYTILLQYICAETVINTLYITLCFRTHLQLYVVVALPNNSLSPL